MIICGLFAISIGVTKFIAKFGIGLRHLIDAFKHVFMLEVYIMIFEHTRL